MALMILFADMAARNIREGKGQKLWKKAKKLIPGGNQLLSKRAEMFLPDHWPAYFEKAKGIRVTDLDGRTYTDFSRMSVGSCVLGYSDWDVNRAVKKAIDRGSMSTLNSPEEVELAEVLTRLHPWADMVRYARTGGEAMSIAVRIARAYSGKEKIAFCGYHGWHDWYLSGNLASDKNLDGHLLPGLEPRGVPRGLLNTAIPFRYNHIKELEKVVKKHAIGVIVMEPFRHEEPEKHFLQKVKRIAKREGVVLIFDEVSAAFRQNVGGVHLLYNISPDIAVFAKAISNGYPMAAIIGTKKVMDAAQSTFISSTYWTERVGPTSALATIKKMKEKRVVEHIEHIGALIGKGWKELAKKHDVQNIVDGTNLDDLGDYRPGIEALKQNGIRSPLVETNFSKSQIRDTAKFVGLSVYDKPSNSCLASRIPWGQRVTAEKLTRIEFGETIVKQLTKIRQVRVRDLNGSAKIEVDKEMIPIFSDNILKQITEKLKMIGFTTVEIDQEGYKPGKINVIAD